MSARLGATTEKYHGGGMAASIASIVARIELSTELDAAAAPDALLSQPQLGAPPLFTLELIAFRPVQMATTPVRTALRPCCLLVIPAQLSSKFLPSQIRD